MPGRQPPSSTPRPVKPARGLRRIRAWEKKRGSRSTGYTPLGGASETLFFATLFLCGVLSLSALIVPRIVRFSRQNDFATSGTTALQAGSDAGTPDTSAEKSDTVATAPSTGGEADEAIDAPKPSGGFDWALWLGIPMFSCLVLAGAAGAIQSAMSIGTSAERRAALANRANSSQLLAEIQSSPKDYPSVPKDTNWKISPGVRLAYRLPIASSPSWRLTAFACFCLLWNGTVLVLAVVLFNQRSAPLPADASWWSSVTNSPFVSLFGLSVLLYAVVGGYSLHLLLKALLAATAIGPTSVEVCVQPFRPGQSYKVFLTQAGHVKVKWLELRLVSEEEVSFSDGTDTRCESRSVFDQLVFRQDNFEILPSEPFQHTCQLDLPADAMHSFSSAHNAVVWRFVVRGEAEKWPTFERVFPLVVYPSVPEPLST